MNKKKKVGFFDIEANNLLPEVDKLWCVVTKDMHTGELTVWDCNSSWDIGAHLQGFDVLVGHNCIYYDFPVLRKLIGFNYEGTKVDTLIMSRTQRPTRRSVAGVDAGPHSVASWAHRLGTHKVANDVWDEYNPIIRERCVQDVEVQEKIYYALLEEGKGEGWTSTHRINNRLFNYLQLQEEYGWTVDQALLRANINTLHRWIDRISVHVNRHLPLITEVLETKKEGEYGYIKKPFTKAGTHSAAVVRYFDECGDILMHVAGPFSRVTFRRVNLDKPIEVKDFLLSEGWEPLEWNTDAFGNKRSPKLSKDDEFDGITKGLGKLIARRIQCKQRLGVLEGWRDAIREDGRIPTPISGIATTGRLRHKLIVNVPNPQSGAFFAKQMRQCFIAKPGWVMIGCDSKSNQMRQFAARMRKYGVPDEEFEYAVMHGNSKDGTDLHTLNMKRTGIQYRNRVKNFFYGCVLFGAGDAKTAKILETTKEEAKKVKETYFQEMPGLPAVLEALSKEWSATAQKVFNPRWNKLEYKNGKITGVDGRPITVEFEKDLLAYALQSDEAIQMGYAYVLLHEWMADAGYKLHEDWGMLIWMHDEFQMECKPEIQQVLSEMACRAIKVAGEELNIQCPHDGDAQVGNNWYECH